MGESVAALRFYAKTAPIISFEPNPFFASRIARRFRSDPNVEVRHIAISDVEGTLPLYIPVYRYTTFPELATLNKTEAGNWLPSRIIHFNPAQQTILELECRSCNLDSLGLDPEIVKIDTRCNASAVIEGGVGTIVKSRPIILLGYAILTPRCRNLLEDANYLIFSVHKNRLRYARPEDRCDFLIHTSFFPRLSETGLIFQS